MVEPLARLTSSGQWKELPCGTGGPFKRNECLNFAREYLNKPHAYTVISADGKGVRIKSQPTNLSECYDFTGTGTYSGGSISRSAIAASSNASFADVTAPRLPDPAELRIIRKALNALVPKQLDSTQDLRLFMLALEGRNLVVIQRAFAEIAAERQLGHAKLIFAIGSINQGQLNVLQWKENTEDEDQRFLGTIRLRNGREFLVTAVSDPESQSFRVYGIRDGRVVLVFSGGGSGC